MRPYPSPIETRRRPSVVGPAIVLAAAVGAWATHGSYWGLERSEEGSVTGIDIDTSGQLDAPTGSSVPESTEVTTTTLDPAVLDGRVPEISGAEAGGATGQPSDLLSLLRIAGAEEPWCSNKAIKASAADFITDDDVPSGRAVEASKSQTEDARICLEEETIEVKLSPTPHVVAFMRTDPRIPQVEGNPSIFLSFEESLDVCLEAKETMRESLEESIEDAIGRHAAADYEIEIHVDPRNMKHPCDDRFIDP